MAIVNRMWETAEDETRRLVTSDVRGVEKPWIITVEQGIKRLGGERAAIEYGIKAALSDCGSGAKTAAAKIAAQEKWLNGSPDPAAIVAEYEKKMADMVGELRELRALRESLPGRA